MEHLQRRFAPPICVLRRRPSTITPAYRGHPVRRVLLVPRERPVVRREYRVKPVLKDPPGMVVPPALPALSVRLVLSAQKAIPVLLVRSVL